MEVYTEKDWKLFKKKLGPWQGLYGKTCRTIQKNS